MQIAGNTTFSQIYQAFKPGPLDIESKHLRLQGTNLHTHNPLMPHGKGTAALNARIAKYDQAANAVKQAIDREFNSPGLGNRVFQNLNLGNAVTLRDLRAIRQEIAQELQRGQVATGGTQATNTVKSDLSDYAPRADGDLTGAKAGAAVLLAEAPELQHARTAFREFLAKTLSDEAIPFYEGYAALIADPSPSRITSFVNDVLRDPGLNLYDTRDAVIGALTNLGPNPTAQDVQAALAPAFGELDPQFGAQYGKFRTEYMKS